jgi:hypothetical protein
MASNGWDLSCCSTVVFWRRLVARSAIKSLVLELVGRGTLLLIVRAAKPQAVARCVTSRLVVALRYE